MGYEPEFQKIAWQFKDILLEEGTVDCLWGCFSMTGREDRYQWAGPYMYSRQVMVVRSDSGIYRLSDLNGKRIAVQNGSRPEELLLNHQVDGVEQVQNVYSFVSMDEVFAALNKSYVDAGAGHETAYRHFMSHHTGSYRILEQELLRVGLGAAFSLEDDRGLAEQLDAVLEEMKEDGTIADILAGYGVDAKAALVGGRHEENFQQGRHSAHAGGGACDCCGHGAGGDISRPPGRPAHHGSHGVLS